MTVPARIATAALLLFMTDGNVFAQTAYPSKAVRFLVGAPPGGSNDIFARAMSQRLSEALGQPVVVENRPGANQMIAADVTAKAPADGHTIYITTTSYTTGAAIQPKLPFDPVNDLAGITMIGKGPMVLVVHPSVPAKSVKELIALAKAKPGQLNFASGGSGTSNHLALEMFKLATGTDIVHIPYKGSGQSLTDVINGRVQMIIGAMLLVMPQVKAGKLRGLAVTSAQRTAAMPEMPTIAESGLPGFETTSWHGLLVPVRTPKSISARLHDELVKRLKQPETRERLASQGIDAVGNTPEQFAAYIKSETEKWAKVIKQVGIKPE